MKSTIMSLLAVAVLMAMPARSQAQDQKPVAVLSVASYDEVMADLNFFGKLAEQPELASNLEGMLKLFTQGQGLNGLNKKSPWGVAVTTDGQSFSPVAFLPVTDLKRLLTSLSGIIGEAGKADSDGVIEINSPQGQTVFVKSQSGWAFIAQQKETLATVPSDPLKVLADLPQQYDISLRAYVQNIPSMYRNLAIGQIRAGVESSLDRRPDEGDAQYEQRKKFVQSQVESIERAFAEADTFTVGWQIDQEKQSTFLDFSVTALADTRLAKQMDLAKNAKTNFSGFISPSAAVTANVSSEIGEEDIDDTIAQIEVLRTSAAAEIDKDDKLPNDEAKDLVKDVLDDFMDILVATVKSGKIDSGLAVILEPKTTKLIAGAHIVDGKALDAALKKLVTLAQNEKNFPGVKFNAVTHKNIKFHKMVIPVQDEEAHKVLGESLDVHIGVGDKVAYLAVGAGSIDAIKKAIDNSASAGAKAVSPVNVSVALGAVMKFAAAMEENPVVSAIAEQLEKAKGKDHILMVALPIKNGITYRLQAEEGVLQAVGQASRMSGAGAGGL